MKNNITNNYQNDANLKKYKLISVASVPADITTFKKKDVTDDVFTGCSKKL